MGPTLAISEDIHALKYRLTGETFHDSTARVADGLADDREHFRSFLDVLRSMRFLPGGRVQAAIGAPRRVTPYNCFVSGTIDDSMDGIMVAAQQAAETMRLGGGIGYDFSTLRPRGDRIVSLDSQSSGPVSFMGIFNSICQTISSAGHRRGAQMGVLRVDHPDIEDFIQAKTNTHTLNAFNVSVGVTDEFIRAVRAGDPFELKFGGRAYKRIDARSLWDEIMRATWDWAEPGVLFIDTINRENNLWYCEEIAATNPCGEQPLPPYGACLLGSFNLTRYVSPAADSFNFQQFRADIPIVVRAMDNIVDRATYPLIEQEQEALSKRRMGLGISGLANAGEALGYPYGSIEFIRFQEHVLSMLRDEAYSASAKLASEKGSFPLYQEERFLASRFVRSLPPLVRKEIITHGIRNSHLLSIAPTGTISLSANNISSGIEPVYALEYDRIIQRTEGPQIVHVMDYGLHKWGVKGRTADQVSPEEHVKVLTTAQKYMDSAVSKTCNIGADVKWEDFKDVYMRAFSGGAKGVTTFREAGKRTGILSVKDAESDEENLACSIDLETGIRSCE